MIPQSELVNYPKLKGHTYLNLNPDAKTVQEKMKVILGMVYNIDVLVKSSPSDPDSVYRPVFFDVQKQKTYNGQRLYEERDRRTEEL